MSEFTEERISSGWVVEGTTDLELSEVALKEDGEITIMINGVPMDEIIRRENDVS